MFIVDDDGDTLIDEDYVANSTCKKSFLFIDKLTFNLVKPHRWRNG